MPPVQCNQCDWAIFQNKASFTLKHAVGHGHTADFVCLECMATFATARERKSHMTALGHTDPIDAYLMMAAAMAMPGPAPPPASAIKAARKCSGCGEDVKFGEVHAQCDGGEGDEVAKCPVCGLEFEAKDDLVNHVSSVLPCATCMTCLSPFQTLEDHYWDSNAHPKCRPCGLGFENFDVWDEHKLTCPIAPGGKSSGSKAAGKRPEAAPPAEDTSGPTDPGNPGTTSASESTSGATATAAVSGVAGTSSENRSAPPPVHTHAPKPVKVDVPQTQVVAPQAQAPVPQAPQARAAAPKKQAVTSPKTQAVIAPQAQPPVQTECFCTKCKVHFSSVDTLQTHYKGSEAHPTCRTCEYGFESLGTWATHKGRCPPPRAAGGDEEKAEEAWDGEDDAAGAVSSVGAPFVTQTRSQTVAPAAVPRVPPTVLSASGDTNETVRSGPAQDHSPLPQASSNPGPSTVDQARALLARYRQQAAGVPHGGPAAAAAKEVNQPPAEPSPPTVAATIVAVDPPSAGPSSSHNAEAKVSKKLSYHCRSCRADPCVDPVVTACGHLFCHDCIANQPTDKMTCPVCKTIFMVRLKLEVED